MMKKIITLCMLLVMFSSYCHSFTKDSVMLQMKDGAKLNTNIFKPGVLSGSGPVILIRTTYGADSPLNTDAYLGFITDIGGYIVVAQDTRGHYESEGEDSLFLTDGWGHNRDGYETIEWIAGQPWCNGKIGMFGASALAITQYRASAANPPNLTCGVPVVGAWNFYSDCIYQGGEYREKDVDSWIAGNSTPGMLKFAQKNYNYSPIWDSLNCNTRVEFMHTPFLHIGGWYDFFFPGQLEAFYQMQYNGAEGAAGNQKIIIGPWTHGKIGQNAVGGVTFPSSANYDVIVPSLEWFNYWLKGDQSSSVMSLPAINLYLMGPVDETGYWNNWIESDDWSCFTNTDTLKFYLNDDESLSEQVPESSSKNFLFDPAEPVPTVGGNNLSFQSGPYDQSNVWERQDVLRFISREYAQPFDIFGRIKLNVTMSSDRTDTDISAKLVDIYPDGKKILISDGIIMARHRLGFDREDFLQPGEKYELTVDLNYTAYTIIPGHRLGLAVSSSNYPKYAVNSNTGSPLFAQETKLEANNTIHTGHGSNSSLILPIRKNGFNGSDENPIKTTALTGTVVIQNSQFILPISVCKASSRAIIYDINGRIAARYDFSGEAGRKIIPFDYQPGIYLCILYNGSEINAIRILNPEN